MADKKVAFGVIGASGMARRHMESIIQHLKTELAAICDTNEERLNAAGGAYGIDALYTDYREMLMRPDIDAVLVCTPDFVHAEMTEAALAAGKHVICEKPMALTMAECDRMLAAERKYGKKLMIGQICRYAPGFKLAKELIDRGEIGELYYVESEYAHDYIKSRGLDDWRVNPAHPREPFIGGGCHAVDLLRWIAGNPHEVCAYSNHKCLPDWPVNDCTISIFRFPNEVIGKVFVSIGCKRDYTMRSLFYGTEGTIICDNTSSHLTIYKTHLEDKDSLFAGDDSKRTPIHIPVNINNHNTYAELDGFALSILDDTPVPTNGYEGAATVAVCTAATESAKIGAPVKIVYPEK